MMNLSLFILSALCSPLMAFADAPTELDLTPMINFFRKQVRVTDRPFKTYNWAPRSDFDGDKTRADLEVPTAKIQRLAASFWANYNSQAGKSQMYGFGLYSALDPRATNEYGTDSWRLIEFTFPVGTRILDFANYGFEPTTIDPKLLADTVAIEKHYGCPESLTAEVYFNSGGADLPRRCAQLVYTVFDRGLHIDAFAYGYAATRYKACGARDEGSRAFVMTRGNWITASNTRVFTADDLRNTDDRLLIQTLLMRSEEYSFETEIASYNSKRLIAEHFDRYPDRDVDMTQTTCEGDTCRFGIRFCSTAGACDHMFLPPLPRPGGPLITAAEADKTRLLWKDLIGRPKSPVTTAWLKANKFGCEGRKPYPSPDGH